MKIMDLRDRIIVLLQENKRNDAVKLISELNEDEEALNTIKWIGETQDARAEAFTNSCQVMLYIFDDNVDKAVDFVKALGDQDLSLSTFRTTQIILKECGLPEGGMGVPSNMKDVLTVSNAGIDYALEQGDKLFAAKLNNNIASFLAPEFDENIIPANQKTGLDAANRALDLFLVVGDTGQQIWAHWMVGIFELAGSNGTAALEQFSKAKELATPEDQANNLAWMELFHGKTLAKLVPSRKDEGFEQMETARNMFEEQNDEWGLGEAKKILKGFNK